MKLISLAFLFCLITASARSQNQNQATDGGISLSTVLSYRMLEPNQDLRKIRLLLEERKLRPTESRKLILGTSLIALADFQHSNTDSKFGYLMRHPTAKNQIGQTVSEAVVHSFQFSSCAIINKWLTAYGELLYDPQQSFGDGTITKLSRNQIQLRKGFIAIGDFNRSPMYGAIGKMDVPFGLMGSVNPFTNSSMWHAFGGLSYGAQVGIKLDQFNATLMLAQGGAQFRALNTPVRDSTNVPSRLNNFALDINYQTEISDGINMRFGGSYLHGSAYCQDFPVQHFDPCNERNPAASLYAEISAPRILTKLAWAATTKEWPGTHNPTPPLDIHAASNVSSLSLGLQYLLHAKGELQYLLSAEFSNFRAGVEEAPWERQNQWIFAMSAVVNQSSRIFLEVFRVNGYTPLNFISGSAAFSPFPPGITHSQNDVIGHGLVLGALVTL